MRAVALTTALLFPFCMGPVNSLAEEKFDPVVFATHGKFTFNDSKLQTQSAFVTLTDELFKGKTNTLVIRFFKGDLTEDQKENILNNDARNMAQLDHAVMVLFLDEKDKIRQVKLTYQMTGVYTVAKKPGQIKDLFADYTYDGERLHLESSGVYTDSDKFNNPMTLTWDVNVDLPVFERLSQTKRK